MTKQSSWVLLSRYFPASAANSGEVSCSAGFVKEDQPAPFRDKLQYPFSFALPHQLGSRPFLFLGFDNLQRGVAPYSAGIFLYPGFHPGFLASADPDDAEFHGSLCSQRYSSGISTSGALLQSSSRL